MTSPYNLRVNPKKSSKMQALLDSNMNSSDDEEEQSNTSLQVSNSEANISTNSLNPLNDQHSEAEKDTETDDRPNNSQNILVTEEAREDSIANINDSNMATRTTNAPDICQLLQNLLQEQKKQGQFLGQEIQKQGQILGQQIQELSISHKINNQKIDNLDRKIDNLQTNLELQIINKEEQILENVKGQINDLSTNIQANRQRDLNSFNEQIEQLKSLTEEESKLSLKLQEKNKHKFQEIDQQIEKQKTRIHVMEDKIDEIQHTQQTQIKNSGLQNILVTCTGTNNQESLKFDGRFTNLQAVLSKLKRQYDKNRARFGTGIDNDKECLHEILDINMEKSANQWWQLNKHEIQNWKQFETKFVDKYWNMDIQRHLRQKIEFEHFRPGGRLNRVDYFLERVLVLKSMTPPLHEDEIINIMVNHYDQIIQTAHRVQNVNTIKSFELLLQREDMLETQQKFQNRN